MTAQTIAANALVERLRANADPRCNQHVRSLSAEAAATITRLTDELAGVKEALGRLERANDAVASATTRERYLTDLADVQPALLDLDDARANARALLGGRE